MRNEVRSRSEVPIISGKSRCLVSGKRAYARPSLGRIIMLVVMVMLSIAVLGIGNTTAIAYIPRPSPTSPDGGEVWRVGEIHTIKWDNSDDLEPDFVNIYITVDDDALLCIANSIPNTGRYSWLIPPTITSMSGTDISLISSKLKIVIEANPFGWEIAISTNYFTIAYPIWDINQDGIVDMRDIAIVGKAFGSSPGQPTWNPAADLNVDGKVDMRDIGLVAKHFGETY